MLILLTSTLENWWHSLVIKFNSFDRSTEWFIEVGFYALGGLIVGFLLKHYARLVFFALLLTIGLIALLDHYAIVTINYDYLAIFSSLSSKISLSQIIDLCVSWLGNHIAQTVAACLGLFIAWELG
jgi:uncharacterized membrane protein (Fun14 family)